MRGKLFLDVSTDNCVPSQVLQLERAVVSGSMNPVATDRRQYNDRRHRFGFEEFSDQRERGERREHENHWNSGDEKPQVPARVERRIGDVGQQHDEGEAAERNPQRPIAIGVHTPMGLAPPDQPRDWQRQNDRHLLHEDAWIHHHVGPHARDGEQRTQRPVAGNERRSPQDVVERGNGQTRRSRGQRKEHDVLHHVPARMSGRAQPPEQQTKDDGGQRCQIRPRKDSETGCTAGTKGTEATVDRGQHHRQRPPGRRGHVAHWSGGELHQLWRTRRHE